MKNIPEIPRKQIIMKIQVLNNFKNMKKKIILIIRILKVKIYIKIKQSQMIAS